MFTILAQSVLIMILSSIAINYHNRLCEAHPDECGNEVGKNFSILSLVIAVLIMVYYIGTTVLNFTPVGRGLKGAKMLSRVSKVV